MVHKNGKTSILYPTYRDVFNSYLAYITVQINATSSNSTGVDVTSTNFADKDARCKFCFKKIYSRFIKILYLI